MCILKSVSDCSVSSHLLRSPSQKLFFLSNPREELTADTFFCFTLSLAPLPPKLWVFFFPPLEITPIGFKGDVSTNFLEVL